MVAEGLSGEMTREKELNEEPAMRMSMEKTFLAGETACAKVLRWAGWAWQALGRVSVGLWSGWVSFQSSYPFEQHEVGGPCSKK